ncbi:Phosphomutase-like protein 3 [Tolypocladium ophioglossoides CBS 100239]|uniref:Phosphomutase-like protein 3 n=1 Tax=Tolypocladium ophioglossoides (strain CBS 100239) TaxID=1163406 RepID=A0A0L0MXX2_TOLOC|nr:Phosphomutase-like protein 3 [Tolypocladium ophioglossoides CBS 100239]
MKLSLPILLGLASTALARWAEADGKEIQYSTVEGYFLQDEPDTNSDTFDYAAQNFRLLNRTYPTDHNFDPRGSKTQWERFARWVDYLNARCRRSESVRYKLLVMGRHGQGWHNAAESFYGTPAWNCYWAELDGNGTAVWADALLTAQGVQEAQKANAYFKTRFEQHGMPFFESYYSSPLSRCLQTANTTFAAGIDLPASRPFAPTIKELFRESISIHTCDRRSTKTHIHDFVPNFAFERGFTEDDELWRGDCGQGETDAHQLARAKAALDEVFASDDGTWLSVTSHSGMIGSLLTALGHRDFGLSTGQIIPVLVRAEAVAKPPPPTTTAAGFTSEATCEAPPVTSVATGCVCSTATPLMAMRL